MSDLRAFYEAWQLLKMPPVSDPEMLEDMNHITCPDCRKHFDFYDQDDQYMLNNFGKCAACYFGLERDEGTSDAKYNQFPRGYKGE